MTIDLLVGALTATACLLLGLVPYLLRQSARLQRQHARERDLLVNQILHLSGRTWTPPPADEWTAPTGDEPLVREWTATPEQQPYR